MSGKPFQRSPHFNRSSSPLKYLLACFAVHQILLILFSHELLKILFYVVILKVTSICLLLPFFFSLGNTFLKTHIAGSIFTTYIENNWEKIAGLDPEIQSWNLMSSHFILTVRADSLNIFLLWNWLKDK